MTKNFVRVFQKKAQGVGFPKIGLPSSVQPGDSLTFFLSGAYHTRDVDSVHNGYVMTLPLEATLNGKVVVIDDARKVPWGDMDSSERRTVPSDPALTTTPDPAPVAAKQRRTRVVAEPPSPPPEPPPKVTNAPKATAEEAWDLWSLLDDH